jgi:hypothetical protein
MNAYDRRRLAAIKERLAIAAQPEASQERTEAQRKLLFSDMMWLILQIERVFGKGEVEHVKALGISRDSRHLAVDNPGPGNHVL